jgi:hypothetical protein
MTRNLFTAFDSAPTRQSTLARPARLAGTLAAAGLLLASFATGAAAQPAGDPQASTRLAGSYVLTITPEPGSGVPAFPSVAVITADGRIVNFDPSQGVGGIGMGEVRRSGGRSYDVSFTGFTAGPPFGRFTVNSTVEPVAGGFAGPFRTTITAPDGQVVFTVQGQVVGVRQAVQGY